ncbi:MAG: hypothetical protein CL928_13795 [Deltaproteobacteria bacterium]|nr:hypothetical protein [Deltaproteobacteria bacterium]
MRHMRYSPALRTSAALVLSGIALVGCGELNRLEDYFATTAAEVLFLGISDPETLSALEELGVTEGPMGIRAAATAFLAQATSLESVAANLVDDADRVLVHNGSQGVNLDSQGNGLYFITSQDDPVLDYVPGTTYTFQAVKEGRSHTVSMLAPGVPALSGIPGGSDTHPPGQSLTVYLGGQFDNAIVLVLDGDGNITHDNRPSTASEYVDWIQDESMQSSVTIPGEAFPEAGSLYIIGIAGIREALDSSYENLNPLVSKLAMGSVAVQGVLTGL